MESHARLTALSSRTAWGVVALALLLAGFLALSIATDWRDGVTTAEELQVAAAAAWASADEAGSAVVAAQEGASAAVLAESAAESMSMVELEQKAIEFDARVEAMAQAGEIGRNPWSGLGILPPGLRDEINDEINRDLPFRDAYFEAVQETKDSQAALDAAESEATSRVGIATLADQLARGAESGVAEAKGRMQRSLMWTAGALLFLVIVATSFSIVSSRARTELSETEANRVQSAPGA